MEPIELANYKKTVILTGAGISVASGMRPFRGPGGLWNDQEAFTGESLRKDPQRVWRHYAERRRAAGQAEPNPAHYAVAEFQKRGGEDSWVCIPHRKRHPRPLG